MAAEIRLLLVLHDHQPVGNFDGVIEQAYQDSYLPFLDEFEQCAPLSIALHTSGCLIEWLDRHHPQYVDRLAQLAAAGRIEIVGGPMQEPILTMLSPRDRVGQITHYSKWLADRLGVEVRGAWVPERVWEQSVASDLVRAGIQYTFLDDAHFRSAGLVDDELLGYYLTEDDGQVLSIFPGSERLRYLIPFADPQQTVDYLGELADRRPGAVVAFADDGEKFGSWPDTKKHVYDNGWLRRFFGLLLENRHWIRILTPTEVLKELPPLGKVYLPEGSYREMNEWALPTERLTEYELLRQSISTDPRWQRSAPYFRGGFWRNFKRKYPEADEMYARMQMVSRRLERVSQSETSRELLRRAREELYRGQCNCSYWHGAFGGIYLPHLRNAVYRHLIAADNLLDEAEGRELSGDGWVDATAEDFDFDAHPEVRLDNDKLVALIDPAAGGQIYELDVRSVRHNLLATLARRPEAYHARVLSAANTNDGHPASIHDRVVCKQEGLAEKIVYDNHLRKSLIDHFYRAGTTLDDLVAGRAAEEGGFVDGNYAARVRRSSGRIQVLLSREATAAGVPLTITKGVTLHAGSASLQIAYLLEGLPADSRLNFAVELNFAGMPAAAEGRFFHDSQHNSLGDLGTALDVRESNYLGLADQWLGIDVGLSIDRPSGLWTYPIQSVSQSEGGFELVHQSVVILPHWTVQPDAHGRWSVTMTLAVDVTRSADRQPHSAAFAASY
jgi:alpha-amylase